MHLIIQICYLGHASSLVYEIALSYDQPWGLFYFFLILPDIVQSQWPKLALRLK